MHQADSLRGCMCQWLASVPQSGSRLVCETDGGGGGGGFEQVAWPTINLCLDVSDPRRRSRPLGTGANEARQRIRPDSFSMVRMATGRRLGASDKKAAASFYYHSLIFHYQIIELVAINCSSSSFHISLNTSTSADTATAVAAVAAVAAIAAAATASGLIARSLE